MNATSNSFYVTGGTLRHDAPCYVERRADLELFDGLCRGEFCYVLTSRQMGKSSLMVRTAVKLREQSVQVVVLDLTAVGQNLSPDQWYDGLLMRLGHQLGLEQELEAFWSGQVEVGPCRRFFAALEKVVLPALKNSTASAPAGSAAVSDGGGDAGRTSSAMSLVLFVDEIDVVRSLPFSIDEFFAAIRECYNRRAEDDEFNRLTFCLLGVATPSDLIRDTRTTPFNIGRRIELHDFTRAEAAPLVQGLKHLGATREVLQPTASDASAASYDPIAERLLSRILHWTDGHPYLTQRFCRAVAEGASIADVAGVDRYCEELFLSSRAQERDDNLLFVRERLLRSETDITSLLELYLRVRGGKSVADDETSQLVTVLRLSGIVSARNGRLQERNRIYSRVFDRSWVQAHLPDADLRRQKAAFRRGVMRATAIAAAAVIVMGVLVAVALKQAGRARSALSQAYASQAQALRVSGARGQRFASLEAITNSASGHENQDEAALRNLAIATLALMDLKEGRQWPGRPAGTSVVVLNENFDLYARADSSGTVSVRAIAGDREISRLPGSGVPAQSLLFSPNSRYLGVQHRLDGTNELVVWDWRKKIAILTLPNEVNDRAMDFSRDSRILAFGQPDGRIQVYSLETGRVIRSLESTLATRKPRPPNCIRFHPTGGRLAESCDRSLQVQVWDLGTGQVTNVFQHRSSARSLAWHPNGEVLAAGCNNGEICLWDRRVPRIPKVLYGHEADVTHLAFNHQGDLLASSSSDKTVRLWIPFTGRQMIHSIESGYIEDLVFSTDDRGLGFNCVDSEIQLWEVNPAREYRVLVGNPGTSEELKSIDFNQDGRLLAAASNDGILFWDATNGQELQSLPEGSPRSAIFEPTTGDIIVSSGLNSLRRWHLLRDGSPASARFRVGRPSPVVSGLPDDLGKFALSADGRTGAVVAGDSIFLFDPREPATAPLLLGSNQYQCLSLAPDGTYLACGRKEGGGIDIWDVNRRTRIKDVPQFEASEHFAFSPDREWFVTGTPKAFYFWRVGTWKRGPEFKRLGNQPGPLAFSRDSRLFAMASSSSSIELVRLPDGKSLCRLESPDRRRLLRLVLSPNGRWLAAACPEQLIMVWDLALLTHELSNLNLKGELPQFAPRLEDPRPVRLQAGSAGGEGD